MTKKLFWKGEKDKKNYSEKLKRQKKKKKKKEKKKKEKKKFGLNMEINFLL